MSQPVGQLIDIVLRRVFDPGGTGTSRNEVRDLFSRCQQFVNGATDAVVVTKALTTRAYKQVYFFDDIGADVLKIKGVRHGKRDLSEIPFSRLKQIGTNWFGTTGPRLETFATLGRQVLVIHPAQQRDDSVNVVYAQMLPKLNIDADLVLLPDDHLPVLTRLVEAMLLLKQRDFDGIKSLLEEIVNATKLTKLSDTEMEKRDDA